jgi:hypothetical protein
MSRTFRFAHLRLAVSAAAFAILAGTAAPAAAWNNRGHMMVAAVAWGKMDQATKTKVHALLKQNPMYAQWVAGVPSASRPVTAFMRAATWPDFIKGHGCKMNLDPQTPASAEAIWAGPIGTICYLDDGSAPPTPPTPISGRNVGYPDMLLHKYWHYKDLPFAADGGSTHAPADVNAGSQIAAMRENLRTGSEAQKAYAIPWLVHMVGDIHQPLHSASRFVGGVSDNGGNGVKVCTTQTKCTLGSAQSLHSFWDGSLGSDQDLKVIRAEAARLCNATAVKQKLCDPKAPGAEDSTDVEGWIADSSGLAKATAYAAPVGGTTGQAFRLDAAYQVNAARVARSQVALAGARLAKLLDGNL